MTVDILTPARAVNARLATAQPKSAHLAPSDEFSFPAPPANRAPDWAAAMLTAQISNPAPSVSPRPADAPKNSSQHPPDSVCRAVVAGSVFLLESGSCADGGGFPILPHSACESAAGELGLSSTTAHVFPTSSSDEPPGCYFIHPGFLIDRQLVDELVARADQKVLFQFLQRLRP